MKHFFLIFRVDIIDEPRLPQHVCIECKISIESFIKFCDTIDKTQKSMIDELPFPVQPIKEEAVEYVAPPSPPLSTSVRESPNRPSTSNQVSPDFRIESVCGSSPLVPSDFEFTPSNDDNFYDDFDPVNQFKESEVPKSSHESTPLPTKEKETQPPVVRESIDVLVSRMKKCSVPLFELPIVFVPSETESDSEDENYQVKKKVEKDKGDVSLLEEIEVKKNNNNYKRPRSAEISNTSKRSLLVSSKVLIFKRTLKVGKLNNFFHTGRRIRVDR